MMILVFAVHAVGKNHFFEALITERRMLCQNLEGKLGDIVQEFGFSFVQEAIQSKTFAIATHSVPSKETCIKDSPV